MGFPALRAPRAAPSIAAPQVFQQSLTGTLSFTAGFASSRLFLKSFSATLNPATGGLLNDGDPVSTWPDSSGNGNDVTQATGGNQPIFKTNIINGKPVLRFDGSNDSLLSTYTGPSPASTTFVVGKINTTPSLLIDYAPFIIIGASSPIGTRTVARISGAGDAWGSYQAANGNLSAGETLVSGAANILVAQTTLSGGSTLYRNGTLKATGNASDNLAGSAFGDTEIGAETVAGRYLNGDIAEILVYDSVLSSTDRANVEAYLGNKYSITVAGGTVIDPATISGLKAWFKADLLLAGPTIATLTRKPLKALAATFSSAAALSRRLPSSLTAALSFIGADAVKTLRQITAVLSFVGADAFRTVRGLPASLSFIGADAFKTFRPLPGSLSFIGTQTKRTPRSFTASLSFIASLIKNITRGLSAALSFIGSFFAKQILTRILTATLSFTGSFIKRVGKAIAGVLSFTGADAFKTLRSLTGTFSFIGTLSKSIPKAFTASLSFIGFIVKRVNKALTAILSFIGNLATQFIGGAHLYFQSLFGVLAFVGVPFKRTSRLVPAASLSFIGTTPHGSRKPFGSSVSFGTAVIQTDNFNRSDGPLGSNWISPVETVTSGSAALGVLQIISNQVGVVTNDTHSFAVYSDVFANDQYSQTKVDTSGAFTGVALRVTPGVARFFMGLVFASNDYRIYRFWDNVYESLATGSSVTWATGDILKLQVIGSSHPFTINMYRNGILILSWTSPDSSYVWNYGRPGICIYNPTGNNLRVDDWEGGPLATHIVASDNFNRANGGLGPNWTTTFSSESTLVISGNRVGVAAENFHCSAFWSAATFDSNQYSQFRWTPTGSNPSYTAAIVRADATLDRFYMVLVTATNTLVIYERWDGSYNSLTSVSGLSLVDGDIIRLEAIGNAYPIYLSLFLNGQFLLVATPSSGHTRVGGSPGIGIYSPTGMGLVLDNWEGGDLTGTAASTGGVLTKRTNRILTAILSFIGIQIRRVAHTLSASLPFIGSFVKKISRALSAALSFIGNLATQFIHGAQQYFQSVAGTLSFIGSDAFKTIRGLIASLSFVGSQAKTTSRTTTGSISFIGALIKSSRRILTASLSFIGTLARRLVLAATTFVGTLSFVGTISKQAQKISSGILSFIGSDAFRTNKALVAVLSFSGILQRTFRFLRSSFTAALSFIGSLKGQGGKLFAGILSFAGVINRKVSRILASVLDFVGNITTQLTHLGSHFLSIESTLNFVGNLNQFTRRSLAAVLSFIGTLGKRLPKLLTATLSFIGLLAKRGSRSFTATLSFVGTFIKQQVRILAGTLAFVGSLDESIRKVLAAALSFAGLFIKSIAHRLTASLSFIGVFARQLLKTQALTGALSFIGTLTTKELYGRILAATLNFTGAISKRTFRTLSSVLNFIGNLGRRVPMRLAATLSFAGNLFKQAGKRFSGLVSYIGTLAFTKALAKLFTASLGFIGTLTRSTTRSLGSVLAFIGEITKSTRRILTGLLNFIGTLAGHAGEAFEIAFTATLSFIGSLFQRIGQVIKIAVERIIEALKISVFKEILGIKIGTDQPVQQVKVQVQEDTEAISVSTSGNPSEVKIQVPGDIDK